MADLTYFFLSFSIDNIENAYQAGRDAIREQVEETGAAFDRHLADVTAGLAQPIWEDDTSGETFDVTQHKLHSMEMAEEMLNLHCQAFSTMLHHAWEKHVCSTQGYPEYKCNKAYGELRKLGWQIDRSRLERLRMVVNCVKHDDGELYQHHPDMFDPDLTPLWDTNPDKRNWQQALLVKDEDFTDFIDAIRSSGKIVAEE